MANTRVVYLALHYSFDNTYILGVYSTVKAAKERCRRDAPKGYGMRWSKDGAGQWRTIAGLAVQTFDVDPDEE